MRATLLLLTVAMACASSNVVTQRPGTVIATESRGQIRLQTADTPGSVTDTVAAAPVTVYGVLRQVYKELDVPVILDNPTLRQVGNTNFWKSRRFADLPMTAIVSCGSGPTGPRAMDDRIYMSLVTEVRPTASGGSRLVTTFSPVAVNVAAGESSDRIQCASTGRIEKIIANSVAATLGTE